jgi:hypothetical protein
MNIASSAPLTVGSPNPNTNGASWVGSVTDVALWSAALSPQELPGSDAELVGSWPFTQGSTEDVSSNANPGTLEGGASLVPGGPAA